MSATRTLYRLATAAVLLAAPSAATAQLALQPVHVTAGRTDLADRLAAEAAALPTEVGLFARAARLYEESADARAFGEAKTAQALRTAAFYRYHSGGVDASMRLLERAAQNALASGDVVAAANSYIDAALIAHEVQQQDRAVDLAARAELLSRSPLLDEAQRNALRARVSNPREVALAARP